MSTTLVSGNTYDKYGSKNPIARYLMSGFLGAFDRMLALSGAQAARELGCGEGYLSIRLAQKGLRIAASDLSENVLMEARQNAMAAGADISFSLEDAQTPTSLPEFSDLIVCCEVLEHVREPETALRNIAALGARYFLFSVPNEPLWRVLNMARGKYWTDWGNTPGHIQHWSSNAFKQMLERYFEIEAFSTPLPWSMALCSAKVDRS